MEADDLGIDNPSALSGLMRYWAASRLKSPRECSSLAPPELSFHTAILRRVFTATAISRVMCLYLGTDFHKKPSNTYII
jgi:hypothetical protein